MVRWMKHEIDLSKYQIRTDLIIEKESNFEKKTEINYGQIKVTSFNINEEEAKQIQKKKGCYTTIEFQDVTDYDNEKEVIKIFTKHLKGLLDISGIKDTDSCFVIGLGNIKSTPDSLGPLVIEDVLVTRHLFLLNEVEDGYRSVCSLAPGVTGTNGIETTDLISSIVEKIKPDFVIVIDALASSSIERVNTTIQMSNTGIHPGSGVGNSRKEISKDTLGVPVISIGIPTVVDAVSVVSDTICYMQKHYAFHKKFIGSPLNRLVKSENINYLKKDILVDEKDKKDLLGIVGSLNDQETRQLIYEVLTPIGYNLMVTPKEIDFVIQKLSHVLAIGINSSLHKKTINLID